MKCLLSKWKCEVKFYEGKWSGDRDCSIICVEMFVGVMKIGEIVRERILRMIIEIYNGLIYEK